MSHVPETPAIAPYRPEHERRLADAFGRAFVDDPIFQFMVGSSRQRLAQTTWCCRQGIRLSSLHGTSFMVGSPPCGAALWIPPRARPIAPLWTQLRWGNWEAFFRCGLSATGRIMRWEEDLASRYREHLTEPHWVFDLLAVDPSEQGRGLGRLLIRWMLDRIDTDPMPVFLVTYNPRNVPYYASMGFDVVQETPVRGGPMGWSMRRPAARS
jgi:GNAT superfamily N-acetyltransferase